MTFLSPELRRRVFRAAWAAAFLIGSAGAAEAAVVSKFAGLVEYQAAGSSDWVRLSGEFNPTLKPGDKLRTGRASKAEIKLDDESVIQLSPLSIFSLGAEARDASSVELGLGRLRALVKKGVSRQFAVRTPTAVAAVRGTDFMTAVAEDGSTRVEVYSGIVAAAGRAGEVLLNPGQFTEVGRDGAPLPPQANPNPPPPLESAVRESRELAKREVYSEISKDSILAQAQMEIQSAEYQNRKVAIDAFGRRVRLEEYITRPVPDSFKYVVLNTRSDRFDFGKILFTFNKDLPQDLTKATKTMLSATGSTAPEWQLKEMTSVVSNTNDKVVEEASGGHMVADNASDPSAWGLFFSNYSFYVGNSASTENGGRGKQLWSFADNGDDIPAASEFSYAGGAAPTYTLAYPSSQDTFHTVLTNTFADGTTITAEDFVTFDDGRVASKASFAAQAALGFGSVSDRLNFERVYTCSLFEGRKIDMVFSAKLLKDAGLLRLPD